jgi:zinc transporter 9
MFVQYGLTPILRTHLALKRKYIILTYTVQQNILRTLSSTSFNPYRYNRFFQQKNIDGYSKRSQSSSTPPPPPPSSGNTSQSGPTVLKVRGRKTEIDDVAESYTDNKLITAVRAMHEYLLKPSDLETLKQYKTRSPYSDVADSSQMLTVYRRGDVEKRAYEIWGSPEMLNKEKLKRTKTRQDEYEALFSLKKSLKEYQKRLSLLENASFDNRKSVKKNILTTSSGKVVIAAVLINATNAVVKTIGWLFTGSASLFSEAVHSIADTCNQLILTFGLWQSIKKPNPEHP